MTRFTAALFPSVFPLVVATYMPFCTPSVQPTAPSKVAEQEMSEFWRDPSAGPAPDLFYGPYGPEHAPDPKATYLFVKTKTHGVSPGMTVRGPDGTKWSVKQGEEGPVEVVMSRVLSAVGYHQPPVYFLPSFALDHGDFVERAPGGRFRPQYSWLKEEGDWSWQRNPFVGTKPYQGLLVILLMFNSSDLKNSNNSLYEVKKPHEDRIQWFVVRDIGTALGTTGRFSPKRSDPDFFDKLPFITGVKDGYVEFDYHGWHQELFDRRMTPADVGWASARLKQLSDQQWHDAFRAGGYDRATAERFIARLHAKTEEGARIAGLASTGSH